MSQILTPESTVRDLYATPVGHDVLARIMLQLGASEKILTNPVTGNLKLKWLFSMAKKQIDPSFLDVVLKLVNTEKDVPADRIRSGGHLRKAGLSEESWGKCDLALADL